MADPYMGELRMMSFAFAPKGWAQANGQLLPINQNQALFQLFATRYGGDGKQTFALPNLLARVPIHVGDGFPLGKPGGEPYHTLSTAELPAHTHTLVASAIDADAPVPTGNLLAVAPIYNAHGPEFSLHSATVGSTGGGSEHINMQPAQNVNWCVAIVGVFPGQG